MKNFKKKKTRHPLGKKQLASMKNRKEFTVKMSVGILAVVFFITAWVSVAVANANIITFYDKKGEGITTFKIEVADTEKTRELGLMHRISLDKNRGMLFVFDKQQDIAMWMKNTKIPLDMIFIGDDNKVKCIHKNTTPESLTPLPCNTPVLYVLEVNGGIADEYGINVDSSVKIRR